MEFPDKNETTQAPKSDEAPVESSASYETQIPGHDTNPVDGSGDQASPSGHHWIGRTIGKYQILDVLGVGGMGVVLKGFDTAIERPVAIKVLPAELSNDKTSLTRFLAEAKSAGKLNHPNAVTVYEIAQEEDAYYLVMELVSGGSTWDFLQKNKLYPAREATRITIESCRGLAAAHDAGLVHRDIKPANLLVTADGTVKVSDFGLAKRTRSESLAVTREGQVVGTPYYMSPEQCEARPIDTRSDVYSLGATFYSLLTGKCPYEESGSVVQVMYAHCNSPPPDPRKSQPDVPVACSEIIAKAMAIVPEDRYQTMDEMRVDLDVVLATLSGDSIHLPSNTVTRTGEVLQPKQGTSIRGALPTVIGLVSLLVIGLFLFWVFYNDVNPMGERNRTAETQDSFPGMEKIEQPGVLGEDNAGAAAVANKPAGEPIRVGVLHSLTGTMSQSESPVKDATLLAIEELNETGGVLGRPVEAVVADGRSQDQVFADEARRLIEQEKVATVFGCWTSSSRKTVVPIIEELDHLLIYPVQYEGVEESPNVFYMGAAPNQQIIPAVKWAFAFKNKRRFFLVGSDYVFPRVAHEIIKDELKELGAEMVGEVFLPLGSADTPPIVKQIEESQPDVILNCLNGDSNTAFFTELRGSGIKPAEIPTISFSIGEAELKYLDVDSMVGDYAAWNYFQSIESPENQALVEKFRTKHGEEQVLTDPMESAFTAVKLWAQAVNEAGTEDVPEVRRALRNQRIVSAGGMIRTDSATQHTFKTPRIGRITNDGQFELVWTAAKPERPSPYPSSRTTEQWKALLHDLYSGWGNQWSAPQAKK